MYRREESGVLSHGDASSSFNHCNGVGTMRNVIVVPEKHQVALLRSLLERTILILGFANFTAVAAQIAVPLPFSPVPISGQTLAVLLAGVCLGSRGGALSQLTYLVEGALGLPVFAGGSSGPLVLLGTDGGYLVGFVVAAFVVGWLTEHGWGERRASLFAALALGSVVIYVLGVAWLTHFMPDGISGALVAGVLPFLVGDAVKVLLAATVIPSARRLF